MKNGSFPNTRFGFRSVFARLFFSVLLAILVFAVAMILLAQLVHNNSDSMRSRIIASQIVSQIDPFLSEANHLMQNDNRLQARFILAVVKKSLDIFDESLDAKIGLYDHNRRLILKTENTELPERLPPTPSWLSTTLPALSGKEPRHVIIKTASGYSVWYESRTPPKEQPFLGIFNLFTGTLLLVLIMSAVTWWIAHSMTWRINQMSKQMAKMGDGDFSVRVSEKGNDEIAMLAYGFNQSAQKIERLINANSLLLAHASHEFRTPITRIRLQIEMMDMLAQKLGDDDKVKFDKRAAAINRDLTGLNDLVESILLVSRLDAGHALQTSEEIDLYELVKNECQHYSEATLFAEPVTITAQPKLLTHLVRNLLNNALVHGVPPIEVYLYTAHTLDETATIPKALTELSHHLQAPQTENLPEHSANIVHDIGDDAASDEEANSKRGFFKLLSKKDKPKADPVYAVLAVIDQGAGIPMDKREDIFSPFVRLKQEKKGSGLGLSLIAQIVEAHHGSVITDTWEGKTRFLVVLPIKAKSGFGDNQPLPSPQ